MASSRPKPLQHRRHRRTQNARRRQDRHLLGRPMPMAELQEPTGQRQGHPYARRRQSLHVVRITLQVTHAILSSFLSSSLEPNGFLFFVTNSINPKSLKQRQKRFTHLAHRHRSFPGRQHLHRRRPKRWQCRCVQGNPDLVQ